MASVANLSDQPHPQSEIQPLLPKKAKTYRHCCWCSLGNAVTLWAVFLIGLSLYFIFDVNIRGAVFTAGAAASLLTAAMLLLAAGLRNAFVAYIAFYMQILVYVAWLFQAALTCMALWQARVVEAGAGDALHTRTPVVLKAVISEYPVGDPVKQLFGKYAPFFLQVRMPFYLYEAFLIAFYVVQLLLANFVLRMIWSFYRILQAGGTGFEWKGAEDIEEAAIQEQFPSYVLEGTPR